MSEKEEKEEKETMILTKRKCVRQMPCMVYQVALTMLSGLILYNI